MTKAPPEPAAHPAGAPATIPKTMEAAVYQGRGLIALEERPVPTIGADDVLIEISHCGVCGSDIHTVLDGWAQPGELMGHEYSGTIVALGEHVRASGWSTGDRVVGGPSPRCGQCEHCLDGRPSLCLQRGRAGVDHEDGAYARYKALQAESLRRVPADLGLREAALAEPLAVALHAITRTPVQPDQRILVLGAGPIGTLIVAVLRAVHGVTQITVVEPSPVRQELARRLGASEVLAPDQLAAEPRLPMDIVDQPFHIAYECSGRPAAQEAALTQLRRGGFLMMVGAGPSQPKWNPNRILLNELMISGSFVYDADGFEQALALLASGRLPTDLLIEPGACSLAELHDTVHRLGRGEIAGKVMVTPNS